MKHHSPNQQEALDPSTKPERLETLASKGKVIERLVAGNRNTPAHVLLSLSQKADRRINERLAKNPSTPLPVLLSLVAKHPKEFLQNPVLPLLFLEDSFPKALSSESYAAILSCQEAPAIFCEWAFLHYPTNKLLEVLVKHPNTSTSMIESIAKGAKSLTPKLRGELLAHPNCGSKSVALLVSAGHDRPKKEFYWKLSDEYKSLLGRAGLFAGLEIQPKKEAEKKGFSEAELYQLAEFGNAAQQFVARQPNCPEALFYKLAEDFYVKIVVAQNPKAPQALLLSIAQESGRLAWHALANPSFPPEHLVGFARAPTTKNVRAVVAKHPNLPKALLEELLQDPDADVRKSAAENPTSPGSGRA